MRKMLFLFLFVCSAASAQMNGVIAAAVSGYRSASAAGTATVQDIYTTSYDLDPLNRYVIINYDEPVYSASDLTGVKSADYQITFSQNGGTATNATISSVKNTSNGSLVGGEYSIRVNLTITGSASGVESVQIKPSTATSITNSKAGRSYLAQNTVTATLSLTYNSDYQSVISYSIDNLINVPQKLYRTVENQWVADVVATGEWATLDRCWRMSKHGDQNYALLNWKSLGTGTLSIVSPMTWTRGTGFSFGSGYLNTNFTPSTDATNFTQNDAAVFHASETDVQDSNFDYGVADTGNTKVVSLNPRNSGTNTATIGLNSGQGATLGGVSSSIGTFLNNRTSSTGATHKFYINGVVFDASNFASTGLPNQTLVIGGRRANTGTVSTLTNRLVSLVMLGASMDTNVAALNTAETNFVSSNASVATSTQLTTDGGTNITTTLNTLKTEN